MAIELAIFKFTTFKASKPPSPNISKLHFYCTKAKTGPKALRYYIVYWSKMGEKESYLLLYKFSVRVTSQIFYSPDA